jgi:ATP-dependent RNA helicase RhlE
MPLLRDIERVIRRQVPREVIPGFEAGTEPSSTFVDAPAPRDGRPTPARGQQRRGRSGGAGQRGAAPGKARPSAPSAAGAAKAAQHKPKPGSPAPRGGKPAARSDADAPRSAGPGGAQRSGRPQHRRDEPASNVRSNLPPGWK